mmetsp:Transcript_87288/g.107021  ORF Transcript_87288/g.107021 Transcript_87288/m.107021 type:complete len:121 (+) Transcript_87288:397-759(+)
MKNKKKTADAAFDTAMKDVQLNSVNSEEQTTRPTGGDNEFDTGIDVGLATPDVDDATNNETKEPEQGNNIELVPATSPRSGDDNDDNDVDHVLSTPDGNDGDVPAPAPPKPDDNDNEPLI